MGSVFRSETLMLWSQTTVCSVGTNMSDRPFHQGDRVTWTDASGERQQGHVLQHSPRGLDAVALGRAEEVLVVKEGTAHVSALPPADLERI